MTYQRQSKSPFRAFSNTDSSKNTYNILGDQLDNIEISNIDVLYTGYWVGFTLRDHCNNRGIYGQAGQSWTQTSLLSNITSYAQGAGNNADKSLMSTLHGLTSGSFNFGDDSVIWYQSDSSIITGPNFNVSHNAGTAPASDNNANSNFSLLTFVTL